MTRRRRPKKASTLITDYRRKSVTSAAARLLQRSPRSPAPISNNFMHDVAGAKTAGRTKTAKKRVAHVRGGKGTASRTVNLLGAIFIYAVRHRMRSDNPVVGVMRPADRQRNRRLRGNKYEAFGVALRAAKSGDRLAGSHCRGARSRSYGMAQRPSADAAMECCRPRPPYCDPQRRNRHGYKKRGTAFAHYPSPRAMSWRLATRNLDEAT
jgi:hypothetical protein